MQYEEVHDEGQVSWVLGECAASLVACLEAQSALPPSERLDAAEREALLTSLFDLWKFGYNYGGIEVHIPAAVADTATAHERKRVEAWLRQEMMPGQDSSSKWHNPASSIFWRHSNKRITSAMKMCLKSIAMSVCTKNWRRNYCSLAVKTKRWASPRQT